MPTFRSPSSVAVVAAALAVTLVVGATSGAVAGRLITSKDIQNHTIVAQDIAKGGVKGRNLAENSVGWSKQLKKKTRQRIAALAGTDGIDGLVGPAGPAGAQGEEGPRGPRGLPGGGVVGSVVYDPGDFTVIDDGSSGLTDAYSQAAAGISLPGPGTYLVSTQASYATAGFGAIFFDDPGPGGLDLSDLDVETSFYPRACVAYVMPMCQLTMPYVVPSGAGASVPLTVFALDDSGGCGCGGFGLPDQVRVTVFKMDDAAAFAAVHHARPHGRPIPQTSHPDGGERWWQD